MRVKLFLLSLVVLNFWNLSLFGADRPNLLLLVADDMNWNSIGVYGSPMPDPTPHLDQLARQGIRFRHAHVNVAVCAPSRSIMMTGLYPHQMGATGFAGIDITPTFLEAAGVKIPREMEGRSILPLMKGKQVNGFDRAFTAFYISALEEEVPTRAVQEKQYGYILNLWADGAYQAQNELYKGLALRSMVEAAKTDPEIAQRVLYFLFREREELYDFDADPDGLHNLAKHPSHRGTLVRLRKELLQWMKQTGDPITGEYNAFLNGEYGDFSGPGNPGELRNMRSVYERFKAGEFDEKM